MTKTVLGVSNRTETSRAVQLQKIISDYRKERNCTSKVVET